MNVQSTICNYVGLTFQAPPLSEGYLSQGTLAPISRPDHAFAAIEKPIARHRTAPPDADVPAHAR